MIPEEIKEQIRLFPPLSVTQRTRAIEYATEKVITTLGEAPTLTQFTEHLGEYPKREMLSFRESYLNFLRSVRVIDYALVPFFVALLLISISHMLVFAGQIGSLSYHPAPNSYSIQIGELLWNIIHQLGMFAMSEIGVLYFYTSHSMFRKNNPEGRKVTGSLILAALFAVLTIIANVSSLTSFVATTSDWSWGQVALGIFIGVLVPVATLYLGDRISEIMLSYAELTRHAQESFENACRQYDADLELAHREYRQTYEEWREVQKNPQTYAVDGVNRYVQFLSDYIINYYRTYVKVKVTPESDPQLFGEWTPELMRWLAGREIASIKQVGDLADAIDFFVKAN